MNTGIQRSSATPMYADTTTTPVGSESDGKAQNRKDLTQVIAAHNIPYVAQTTFVQNFKDLHTKAEKAIYTEGAALCHGSMPKRMALQHTRHFRNLSACSRYLLLAII